MIELFLFKLKSLFYKIQKADAYVRRYQKTALNPVMPEYAYINWGKYLAKQGNLKGAIEKFQTSADMFRQIPETYINLGLVYANLKEYKKAAKNFKRAIKLDKNSAKAYSMLAAVLMEENEIEEAQFLYQKASKLDPRDSDIYLNWAVSLLKLKRTQEATDKFKLAIIYNPANFMASYMWGIALVENFKYDEAIRQFEYTLSYNPNDFSSLYYIAFCLMKKKLYKEALNPAQKSLLLNALNIDTYLLLSELYLKLGDKQKCLKCFDDARNFSLKSKRLDLSEGLANKHFGLYDKAKQKFREVLEKDCENQTAMYNLAACELVIGNEDEGYELLLKIIEKNPKHAEALYNIGIYHFKHDDYDKAIDYFQKVVEISPNAVKNIYYDLGNCYAAKCDFDKAIKFYNKNIEYNPEDLKAYVNLTSIYLEIEDYKNAQRSIRAAYKLSKDDLFINYTYAIVFAKLKLYNEAIEKFDFVLSKDKENKGAFWGRLDCLINLNKPKEVIAILDKTEENNIEAVKHFYVKAYTRLACIEPSYYNIEEARRHIAEYKKQYPDFDSKEKELEILKDVETSIGE